MVLSLQFSAKAPLHLTRWLSAERYEPTKAAQISLGRQREPNKAHSDAQLPSWQLETSSHAIVLQAPKHIQQSSNHSPSIRNNLILKA